MKKILFAMLAVTGLFTTSCSNDPIVVDTIDPLHSLTLNISSQELYDKFDLTTDIKNNYLREDGYGIGIFSYVYDANGKLVDSMESILNNFSTAIQTLPKLVEGQYTVITIETLVSTDNGNKAESWSVKDAESLSTIKLKQNDITFWSEAVGLATTQIDLKNNMEVSITPKAIGSIIHYYSFDFETSDYLKVGFATDGMTDYYSLNPQLDRKSRVNVDLTKKGYINVKMVADVDGDNYGGSIYIIEPEITWMNVAQDEDNINNKVYSTWSSNNAELEDGETYYSGFYYLYSTDEDSFASSYLGDRDGLLEFRSEWQEWKEKNLTAELFATPYTNWNVGTVSAVKSYMSGFALYQDIKYDENNKVYSMIYYDSTNHNTLYDYVFKTSTSGLTDSYVYLNTNYFTLADVRNAVVSQGYTYSSQYEGSYFYRNSTTSVMVYQTSSSIVVNYYNPSAYSAPKREMPKHEIGFKSLQLNDYSIPRMLFVDKKNQRFAPAYASAKETRMKKMLIIK